ncbi:MAG TPA: AzlD domain-containing protein [Gaiellaceae bacterium]|nr:AzlD domain-containing protein [Gaiellaceae bacterium]
MTDVWIVVATVGAVTVLFKASGPVLLGRRALPARVQSVVELLAPVMLTALVVTQTFGGDGDLSLDARVPGVAAAAVAVWRRVPVVGAMVIAAVVTALVRAVT